MSEKTLYDLGEQQQRIIEAVWELDEATVRQVWGRISPDRTLAYTSILSAMQKLEAAGWLTHRRQGRHYVYSVTASRVQAQRRALMGFVERVYGGDPAPLIFELLGNGCANSTPSMSRIVQLRREVA